MELIAAFSPDTPNSPALATFCTWLLEYVNETVARPGGASAAQIHQYSSQPLSMWAWCVGSLTEQNPRPPPITPAEVQDGTQPKRRRANTATAAGGNALSAGVDVDAAAWANLGQAVCLTYGFLYGTAFRAAILTHETLPARLKAQKQQAEQEQQFKLFCSPTACARVLGWAVYTGGKAAAKPRLGEPLPASRVFGILSAGKEDGSHRKCMYSDLLDKLQLGQVCVPHQALVPVFVALQHQLITSAQSTTSILCSGAVAIQEMLDTARRDAEAWRSFRSACDCAGLPALFGEVYGPNPTPAQLAAVDAQLRRIQGVLVDKYVHANLMGLLNSKGLLAAKDAAANQTTREARKAEAAGSKAAAGATQRKAAYDASEKKAAKRAPSAAGAGGAGGAGAKGKQASKPPAATETSSVYDESRAASLGLLRSKGLQRVQEALALGRR
ncbi:hypothetical protein HYH03_015040 [Edaphochlamys debaryana]|uniref:Uncharacterized protein n=1 Tax=Edaphochlamys debaryana TaxID=47281 RepID=A0A835XQC3_9CHLO|nr:hypothetical protein HYH03_015040 [Edaphochlamys debaryana]|eukprot:KAG2486336.1 hypothetical protein HYH03_015040 [Edaphochlamys debaryana]